jgi:caffeoyl-CoA O-methyltransferase
MEFIEEKIDTYVCEHTSQESDLLKELNRQTHVQILQPRMLSGHFQGRLLSMLSCMIRPTSILEIGTYTGYSALCLAEGLQEEGKLITIDCNVELEDFTKEYISKSSFANRIELMVGNAKEIIPNLHMDFDLVFIDADKDAYLYYYTMLIDTLKSGAYILADNVLWSGKVVEKVNDNDKDTKSLIEFNRFIQNDERVENILLPIRDGLMLIRKK